MPLVAVLVLLLTAVTAPPTGAQHLPGLLPRPAVAALADEVNGAAALATATALSEHHRMRGSRGFAAAADAIAERARSYGLAEVRVEEFTADGSQFYGTQRARPAWNAEFAELWEMRSDGAGGWRREALIASWEEMPISLAQDSWSGEARARLVDVGAGTAEGDYAGKEVRGRLVLTSSQPGAVAPLAVQRHGAAGIVSWAQNQRSAWWGEDRTLVRWGHLDGWAPFRTFGFMVSPRQAAAWRERLERGETVMLDARVAAGQTPGVYHVVTAAIPGADPRLRHEEIVFTCHLDHPRPGANDNASGCAAILESARTLQALVGAGRIAPPARTLRFVWPPEIEGTLAILAARPEWARRVRAVVHMDMVGGGPETKAVFHVTRGPASLPHFVNDVAEAFGRFVNEESYRHAATGAADHPLVAEGGGRGPLLARFAEFSMGSDHQIYTEGSWRIPAIYLNDWPDRYIHTHRDVPDNLDPTKLERAAFIGAASGYFLAAMGPADVGAVERAVAVSRTHRFAQSLEREAQLSGAELENHRRFRGEFERGVNASVREFLTPVPAAAAAGVLPPADPRPAPLYGEVAPPAETPPAGPATLYRRNPAVRGTMDAFGYSYLTEHLGAEREARLRLPRHQGLWGSGAHYAYDALNLVDGRRSVLAIRDDLAGMYGPVPLELVAEYLAALESIGVVRRVR
jgi:aminopeptidase YwaD